MISDTTAVEVLAASNWETMAEQAEAHEEALRLELRTALEELLEAAMQDSRCPTVDTSVRMLCAEVWVNRVEGRLGL